MGACAASGRHKPIEVDFYCVTLGKLNREGLVMIKAVKNAALASASVFMFSSVLSIAQGVEFFTFARATILSMALAFIVVILGEFFLKQLNKQR